MLKQIGIVTALLATFAVGAAARDSSSNQSKDGHTIIGGIRKVDHAVGNVVVKTAEGTEDTLKFTGKTTARGLEEGGKVAAFAGKEGSRVVAHYAGEGAEKTAVGMERVGKDAPKVVEGVVVGTAKGARTVVIKTPSGAKETLRLTDRCVIDTGKGVVKGSEYTAKEGERVTVHYTEAGSRKVWGLLKRI
ncbi:MAG TPA: hypothetical protein VFV58_27385 [Blastocatellia bacterium]|jgi:hypothetical protein|nr:hypothetical protein [Blastocatellia bacterium]